MKDKKLIEKIKAYILYDYGIDIDKITNKIKDKFNSIITKLKNFYGTRNFIIMVIVLFFPLLGLFTGSLVLLTIAYPVHMLIYFIFCMILFLYLLFRDKLEDKLRVL